MGATEIRNRDGNRGDTIRSTPTANRVNYGVRPPGLAGKVSGSPSTGVKQDFSDPNATYTSIWNWLFRDKRTPEQKVKPAQGSASQGMAASKLSTPRKVSPNLYKQPGSIPVRPHLKIVDGVHPVTGVKLAGSETSASQPPVTHQGGWSPTVAGLGNTKEDMPVLHVHNTVADLPVQIIGPGAIALTDPRSDRADSNRSTPAANLVNNNRVPTELAGVKPTAATVAQAATNSFSTTAALWLGALAAGIAVLSFVTGRSKL
jgi:hypothetical protein